MHIHIDDIFFLITNGNRKYLPMHFVLELVHSISLLFPTTHVLVFDPSKTYLEVHWTLQVELKYGAQGNMMFPLTNGLMSSQRLP